MGKGEGQGEGGGEGRGFGLGEGRGAGFGQGVKDKLGGLGVCCIIILVVLVVLALAGLGIAKIVMGAIYIHECPIQYLIPIWLIVSGCAPILLGTLPQAKPSQDEAEAEQSRGKKKVYSTIASIGALFNFAWLICGTVWIATTYSTVKDGCPGRTDCCNSTLMEFALAMLIIDWLSIGLIIITICIVGCVIAVKMIKK